MSEPTYEKTPVKKASVRKPSVKSSRTKHGHGIQAPVEDEMQRHYREYRMSLKHTNKDVVVAVVIAVLLTTISTFLTTRWYGL